jgi:hypothetical protein
MVRDKVFNVGMNKQIGDDAALKEAKEIWFCLEKAIVRFNDSGDRDTLLRPGVPPEKRKYAAGERAIAHRLAFYLECELRTKELISDRSELVVDCEFNRHNGAPKALQIKEELREIVVKARKKQWDDPDEEGFYVFSVAPDVVVHKRGEDTRNRLVIEIKKASNPEDANYDALKLKLFTTPKNGLTGFGYIFGAWVIAEDKCKADDRCLRIAARFYVGERE